MLTCTAEEVLSFQNVRGFRLWEFFMLDDARGRFGGFEGLIHLRSEGRSASTQLVLRWQCSLLAVPGRERQTSKQNSEAAAPCRASSPTATAQARARARAMMVATFHRDESIWAKHAKMQMQKRLRLRVVCSRFYSKF